MRRNILNAKYGKNDYSNGKLCTADIGKIMDWYIIGRLALRTLHQHTDDFRQLLP